MYNYIRTVWKKPAENLGPLYRERLMQWRRQPATIKLEHPTRLDRARSLGYKAKQGIIIVRQRVQRGGRKRERFTAGRRSKRRSRSKILVMNYQQVAERRAQQQFANLEVLNSYFLAKDKRHSWYEIILVDPYHPVTRKEFLWMLTNPRRVLRGKTSAAQRSRGLHQRRCLQKTQGK